MSIKSLLTNSLKATWLTFFLCACSYHPQTEEYRSFYNHLNVCSCSPFDTMQETPYFLVILVEARHLDYSHPQAFFKTLAKHPSDGSKNGDVGHAWIYLKGIIDEKPVFLEGGHSGELGILQPRYVEGVFLQYENQSENPISYLWECQKDGFFQCGSGNHYPTFAAKVDLTEEQFLRLLKFVEIYDYHEYAITGNQCSSFAAQAAAFAGLFLSCDVTMKIDPCLNLAGHKIRLWSDSVYSEISFSSPDQLEKSLLEAVNEGKAEYALSWYQKRHPRKSEAFSLHLFPQRYMRFKALY